MRKNGMRTHSVRCVPCMPALSTTGTCARLVCVRVCACACACARCDQIIHVSALTIFSFYYCAFCNFLACFNAMSFGAAQLYMFLSTKYKSKEIRATSTSRYTHQSSGMCICGQKRCVHETLSVPKPRSDICGDIGDYLVRKVPFVCNLADHTNLSQ